MTAIQSIKQRWFDFWFWFDRRFCCGGRFCGCEKTENIGEYDGTPIPGPWFVGIAIIVLFMFVVAAGAQSSGGRQPPQWTNSPLASMSAEDRAHGGCFSRYRTAHWHSGDCPQPESQARPALREELESAQPGWSCQYLGALVGIERLEWHRIVELENELKTLREDRDHAFQPFKDSAGNIHTRIEGRNVVCAGYPMTCVSE